jgi:hypothetical protein
MTLTNRFTFVASKKPKAFSIRECRKRSADGRGGVLPGLPEKGPDADGGRRLAHHIEQGGACQHTLLKC